jgi:hypothetical protein
MPRVTIKPHNLKLSGFYDLNKRWSASANFTFVSGTPATFPYLALHRSKVLLIPYNAEEQSQQCAVASLTIRLDVSFRLEGKTMRKNGNPRRNSDYWVFGVYNLYGRRNPFSIYFTQGSERVAAGSPINSEARQLSDYRYRYSFGFLQL